MAKIENCLACNCSVDAIANCNHCGFPMQWLRRVVLEFPELGCFYSKKVIETANARPAICRELPLTIQIGQGQVLVIGRDNSDCGPNYERVVVRHEKIAANQVMILGEPSGQAWAVWGDKAGSALIVDGKRCLAAVLKVGTILQVGPYAWEYHVDLKSHSQSLRPITPIPGCAVAVNVSVPERRLCADLIIRPHEMVALIGPSGCGKSTLLEAIRLGRAVELSNGHKPEIYFMLQEDLVHDDLRLGDELEFVAKFYGQEEVLSCEIDDAFTSVGLDPEFATRFFAELSGGQKKRFRIAAALMSGRGVIVLDEPDSGLDHETATEVIKLLRSVSLRGATVIAVTHHQHNLELFDREIKLGERDGVRRVVADSHPATLQELAGTAISSEPLDKPHLKATRQIPLLITRERKKFTSPLVRIWGRFSLPICLLSLLLIPLFFAVVVSISVPSDPRRDVANGLHGDVDRINRVGFLSVVAVVWMAASHGHLAFVRQRKLYNHEHCLGVNWLCLLTSKAIVNSLIAILQALVYFAFLYLLRSLWLDRSYFVTEHWSTISGIGLCLSLVAVAATALGILVSVIGNESLLAATSLLPVLMMVQILFSVSFAVSDPHKTDSMDGYRQLAWSTDDSNVDTAKLPMQMTSRISYFTLTRYGDQWLRSFAASVSPVADDRRWQLTAAFGLLSWTCIYYVVSLVLLTVTPFWKKIRRPGTAKAIFTIAMASLILYSMPFSLFNSVNAQTPMDQELQVIDLPIVDGKYDSNLLRRQLGAFAPNTEHWRRLDGKDLIALTALQLGRQLSFDVIGDVLRLRVPPTDSETLLNQLAPCHLEVPKDLNESDRVILFIHGLEGGASTFLDARKKCRNQFIATLNFDYPNDGPPEFAADSLVAELKRLATVNPKLRIVIVAHSLGGLVAAWAVSDPVFPQGLVTDIFTLGTPFQGSSLAEFQVELELMDVAWRIIEKDARSIDLARDGHGEAATAISSESEFLKRLHQRTMPSTIRFHLGAGTRTFLSDEERDRLLQDIPGELSRLGVSREFAAKINRFLNAKETQEGNGDGAVTIESATGLVTRHCTRIFPTTHLGLVRSDGFDQQELVFSWVREEMGWSD